MDEFKRLGCDDALVYASASRLSDWKWGTEKWRPPSPSTTAVLSKAAQLLKGLEEDFFFDILWNAYEGSNSKQRLYEALLLLNECELGILTLSISFRAKPNALRYIEIRRLVNHVKARTGKPRFPMLATLLTELNPRRVPYDSKKLQMEYKRAGQFWRESVIPCVKECQKYREQLTAKPQPSVSLSNLATLSDLLRKR